MLCPACRSENRAEARFCDACGSALVLRCQNCDHELRPGARFCDGCGTPTGVSATGPAPGAAPPGVRATTASGSPSTSRSPHAISAAASRTPSGTATTADRQLHLSGRYEVQRLLGEGAKKRVFLARDTSLGREVALALVKTEGLDEASRVRVQREAKAMGQLGDHPHVVTVHDIAEEDGQIYIVSQFMRGGSIEDRLKALPGRRLGRTVILAARIADQAKGGVVLVSSDVKAHVEGGGEFAFVGGRRVDLKGISETQEVFEVAWH